MGFIVCVRIIKAQKSNDMTDNYIFNF